MALKKGTQEKEKNYNWRGDNIGYYAIHRRIEVLLGKPKYCENCKSDKEKWYDWANISGEYKYDITDWKRLCRSCHMKEDGRLKKLLSHNIGRIAWNKGKKMK